MDRKSRRLALLWAKKSRKTSTTEMLITKTSKLFHQPSSPHQKSRTPKPTLFKINSITKNPTITAFIIPSQIGLSFRLCDVAVSTSTPRSTTLVRISKEMQLQNVGCATTSPVECPQQQKTVCHEHKFLPPSKPVLLESQKLLQWTI